jgi:hypothetical protein
MDVRTDRFAEWSAGWRHLAAECVVAGILFDRLAGPSWLARQFSGSTRNWKRHFH